ncbi:MAG TPA: mechanosensitive ion channel family protein [Methanobacterium sp.]|nr:mechanosensitive ion channel family protein [Methanobacterium sp.]
MAFESVTTSPWFIDILVIIITLIGAFLIIKWFTFFLKRSKEKWDIDATLIQVLNEIITYSIYAIAIIIILNELGFNITAIAVSLGIFGIAIGFGARDTISNFISGIFILADKSVRVGDIIEISNQKGKVSQLGFRTTTLTTYDKRVIKVPNSIFSSSPYINYTTSEIRRVDLNITIPYSLPLEKTIKALTDTASASEEALKKPKPKVIVKELSDVGVKLKLCIWINDPWRVTSSRSNLARDINKVLNEMRSKGE